MPSEREELVSSTETMSNNNPSYSRSMLTVEGGGQTDGQIDGEVSQAGEADRQAARERHH